jgi:hypothetical protein
VKSQLPKHESVKGNDMTVDDTVLIETAPAWARVMYQEITTKLEDIVSKVTVEQGDLDALGTTLGTIASDLETELAALNVPAGSLDAVNAVVARLRTDVAVPTATPAPTPAPAPTDPTPTPTA